MGVCFASFGTDSQSRLRNSQHRNREPQDFLLKRSTFREFSYKRNQISFLIFICIYLDHRLQC